jgi:hypothetical protein
METTQQGAEEQPTQPTEGELAPIGPPLLCW